PSPCINRFPYTTLFRSWRFGRQWGGNFQPDGCTAPRGPRELRAGIPARPDSALLGQYLQDGRIHRDGTLCLASQAEAAGHDRARSEEHTSELQSRENLV